jgi:RNA polymerase sigma-70 factor (ECF subfamily)
MLNLTNESADTSIIQLQTRQKLHDMLKHLPEEQREVIILRHFADMSFKEIAKITNTSINTSLGRMRYGLINLRKMMLENQIVL